MRLTFAITAVRYGLAIWLVTSSWMQSLLSAQQVPLYKGGATCTFCHSRQLEDNVKPFYRDLVLLNEGIIVRDQDKHALAYKVLEGPLAQAMGKQLGWKVTEDQRCLSCHANMRADVMPVANFGQVVQEGVGCEACHGPGSLYELLHQRPDWRTKSPGQKAELGMVDVRDPVERLRQCASCHVGDVAQGKVVTHEMYAAGHPPLPPLEAAAFAEQMPRHWRYLCEKGAMLYEAEFIAANYPNQPDRARHHLPVAREVLLGDLTVSIVALRLESQLAATATYGLDLALFDCSACHHELRYPSWRQERGYLGSAPGRPLPADHYLSIIPAVLRGVAANSEQAEGWLNRWRALQRERHEAFTQRPFGAPAEIVRVSGQMADWLDTEIVPVCRNMLIDEQLANRLTDSLIDALENTSEYYAARLLAWGVWALVGERAITYPEAFRAPQPLPGQASEIDQRVAADLRIWQQYQVEALSKRREVRDATFGQSGLDRQLRLVLPAGQKIELVASLGELLEGASQFDPYSMRQNIRSLRMAFQGLDQSSR